MLVCNVYRAKNSFLAALLEESRLIVRVLCCGNKLGYIIVVQGNHNASIQLNILVEQLNPFMSASKARDVSQIWPITRISGK